MTLGELIESGAKRFAQARVALGQGTLSFRDEARWLALEALQLPVDSPDNAERLALSPKQVESIEAFFRQRVEQRLPAAYITKTAWLKGYSFHSDARAIIPRSFIAELLVGKLHPFVKEPAQVRDVLDLCTGSGCLAVIAADQFPNAQVIACDLSPAALELAQANIARHRLETRISTAQGNLFEALESTKRFDLIVCNPPYVPRSKAAQMPKEFCYEPEMALYAEESGMALVRQILQGAAGRLTPDGILVMEIGHEFNACNAMLTRDFPGVLPTWIESDEQIDNVFVVSRKDLLALKKERNP
jgi:ribosomal protein L3 glutamine methyltransferase